MGGACSGDSCDTYYDQKRGQEPYTFLTCIPTKKSYEDRDCSKDKGCVYVSSSSPIPVKSIYEVDADSLSGIDEDCIIDSSEKKEGFFKRIAKYFKKDDSDINKCSNACNIWCRSLKGAGRGEIVSVHKEEFPYAICACYYLD